VLVVGVLEGVDTGAIEDAGWLKKTVINRFFIPELL
jgi:hypothetical protein